MNIKWDSEDYKKNFDFVHRYGEDVLSLIEAAPGAFAVDLGCGNGALTQKLKDRGYEVLGVDASEEMLRTAAADHPSLSFIQADAVTFELAEKADVIFSNAVFHWIDDQDGLLANLYEQLKPGGELVFEFGGKGCAEAVHSRLETEFAKHGLTYPRVFYFPSVAEYAARLEKHGFDVRYAILFDRPTLQKGKDGLISWIRMFDQKPFEGMDPALAQQIMEDAAKSLKDRLLTENGWVVDYVRIRMRAIRKQ